MFNVQKSSQKTIKLVHCSNWLEIKGCNSPENGSFYPNLKWTLYCFKFYPSYLYFCLQWAYHISNSIGSAMITSGSDSGTLRPDSDTHERGADCTILSEVNTALSLRSEGGQLQLSVNSGDTRRISQEMWPVLSHVIIKLIKIDVNVFLITSREHLDISKFLKL